MMTNQEVIDAYAAEGIEINETQAAENLAQAMGDNPDYFKLVRRIQSYAAQEAQERYADNCEAREFQEHYE